MKTSILGLVASTLVFLATSGVTAFSSFAIYGGAVHQELTREALEPLGFEEPSLYFLERGLQMPDEFYTEDFHSSVTHYTDMKLAANGAALRDDFQRILDLCEAAVRDYQAYRECLLLLGQYLHCTQDFYAHTNWVELNLVAGEEWIPLGPVVNPETVEGLVSPFFLMTYLPPRETTDSRAHEQEFQRPFFRDEELDPLSDRQRIRISAEAPKAFTHHQLAKDDPAYPQSGLRWHPEGPSMYELTYEVAARDTSHQWRRLEAALNKRYGDEAETMIRVLKTGWTSSWPSAEGERAKEVRLRVTELDLEVSRDLKVISRLVLQPLSWDRASAQTMTELFNDLTQRDSTLEKDRARGVKELSLLSQPDQRQFVLSMTTDLNGALPTYLSLRPEEDDEDEDDDDDDVDDDDPWLLSLSFPPRLELAEGVISVTGPDGQKVRSFEEARIGKFRVVSLKLDPPADGWVLPDWLDEYLETFREDRSWLYKRDSAMKASAPRSTIRSL